VVGDLVIVPRLPKSRDYLVGRVTGGYRYASVAPPSGHHQRPVDWLGTFDRADLSPEGVNTLGAILTLFRPTAVEAELRSLLTRLTSLTTTAPPPPPKVSLPDADVPTPGPTDPVESPSRPALDLPPLHFDVATDERGRSRIVCDHPAGPGHGAGASVCRSWS